MSKIYSTKQVAELLELKQDYVTSLCRDLALSLGEEYVTKIGNCWVISEKGFDRLKNRNVVKGRPKKKK